jgi:hypothetical protein
MDLPYTQSQTLQWQSPLPRRERSAFAPRSHAKEIPPLCQKGSDDTMALTACCSTHRMCAERRLLTTCVNTALRKGIPSHCVASWIHRKTRGGTICITRTRADGSLGCSVPCIACRRELVRYNIKVQCVKEDGTWFRGYMTDEGAPDSKPTSGQKRNLLANSRDQPVATITRRP